MRGIQVVVLEVHQIHLPHRHRIDLTTVEQLHTERAVEGCVDTAVRIVPSHLFTMERHRLLLVEIPDHHTAEPFDLLRLQRLHAARVALREVGECIVLHHIPRIQILEGVGTHQDGRVGE